MDDFEPQTCGKAVGNIYVLLLDSHSSHYTPQLLHFAQEHNIYILGYPQHCTHTIQGLDVVCFACMKEIWHEEIHKFEDLHLHKVCKEVFTEVFGMAFIHAFTQGTVPGHI